MQILLNGAARGALIARPDINAARLFEEIDSVQLGLSELWLQPPKEAQRQRRVLRPKAGELQVPGKWRLHVRKSDKGPMLGPVIAVFTSSSKRRSSRPFGPLSSRFRKLIEQSRQMGALAFVFTPRGIRWSRRSIVGYTWIGSGKSGRWIRGVFPFPNVVYNRVPTRKAERRPKVNRARKRLLEEPDLHFFNPQFLDKWEVYQVLMPNSKINAFLPETSQCRRTKDLIPFLKEHRHVYLKMAGGSLGNGTAKVDLESNGRMRWRATKKGRGMASRMLKGTGALSSELRRLRRGRTYLMQQAISLLRVNGRPFDIRALVQKDLDEGWRVTGMAARIAGKGQITTHRPRGGSRAKLAPLLNVTFNDKERARQVLQELQRVIILAAQAFDQATGGRHGELSMDVGLDQDGRPWILELNAKPAIFDEPAIRRVARKRLLRYCFRKGGFQLPELKERLPRE